MSIENQIKVNADEPEQKLASEIYTKLCNGETIHFEGELYELNDITESLMEDSEALLDAVQDSVTDDKDAISKLYIKTIQSLME